MPVDLPASSLARLNLSCVLILGQEILPLISQHAIGRGCLFLYQNGNVLAVMQY